MGRSDRIEWEAVVVITIHKPPEWDSRPERLEAPFAILDRNWSVGEAWAYMQKFRKANPDLELVLWERFENKGFDRKVEERP